jgi:hypothetical protein
VDLTLFFFGFPGSLNDINVLHRSHLLAQLAKGDVPVATTSSTGGSTQWGSLPTVYTWTRPYL